MMKHTLLSIGFAAAAMTSQAAIVWTGASDSDPFNDANWDLTGSTVTTIAVNTAILDNLTVSNLGTSASGDSAVSFGQFQLGEGFSMTITGTSFDLTGNEGFAGSGAGATETVTLIGSTSSLQFFSNGIDVIVDGTSSLTIRGGGDGINSQTAESHVNLLTGGMLTMTNAAEITEQIGEGDIFVNGVQVTAGNRVSLISGTGATITALAAPVPEPSSTALLGLGGLALLLRRRK